MVDYYKYGKANLPKYMGWGSWKSKSKISPAALNYPKSKILKMLKEQYVSDEEVAELGEKEEEDWDWGDYYLDEPEK